MTVQVLQGPPHDCDRDGHMIALRCKWDIDSASITPFCEVCRLIFLPSSGFTGWPADELMKIVARAQVAKEAPPEAYEGLFE